MKIFKSRDRDEIITRTYVGNENRTTRLYREDSASLAREGYFPVSQVYVPGTWGLGAFLLATIACFLLIGFLMFLYMLIVKPDGTLTVTYELREAQKSCPKCAEKVMAAALVCRFCGHEFPHEDKLVEDDEHPASLQDIGQKVVGAFSAVVLVMMIGAIIYSMGVSKLFVASDDVTTKTPTQSEVALSQGEISMFTKSIKR